MSQSDNPLSNVWSGVLVTALVAGLAGPSWVSKSYDYFFGDEMYIEIWQRCVLVISILQFIMLLCVAVRRSKIFMRAFNIKSQASDDLAAVLFLLNLIVSSVLLIGTTSAQFVYRERLDWHEIVPLIVLVLLMFEVVVMASLHFAFGISRLLRDNGPGAATQLADRRALRELHELLQIGAINQVEFEAQKKLMIGLGKDIEEWHN